MESESSRNGGGEICPKLLDLIPTRTKEWKKKGDFSVSEERKLELKLGPPGDEEEEDWFMMMNNNRESIVLESPLSLGSPFSSSNNYITKDGNQNHNNKLQWCSTSSQQQQQQQQQTSFLGFPSKDSCNKRVLELQNTEKKVSSSSPISSPTSPANATVNNNNNNNNNTSQKRTAPAPVVGWPPVRSFRKNLTNSSSSKPPLESQKGKDNNNNNNTTTNNNKNTVVKSEICKKGQFVKINMDGVPIGRKVDLQAYNSYDKLSSAVDELFRGLLAAQQDSSSADLNCPHVEEVNAITGLLDGTGEYTLVYEDNEGDRMLVGDVPWNMFASTVKRLRVLKSSELSALHLGNSKQGKKTSVESGVKCG